MQLVLTRIILRHLRLETSIHLPNFGQLNKLWEKLFWYCCEGWSFLIELTACFDPVNVIRKKETIAYRGVWVTRQVATPKRNSCHMGLLYPHIAQVCAQQRALFYTWIHFIQQLAVFIKHIFTARLTTGLLCSPRLPVSDFMRQNAWIVCFFLSGNVLILKVGYALKCEIVLHRGGKNQRCKGFFFSFKECKPFGYPKQRRLFIQRAKEKHQRNRLKHKIPLLLLLNLPQDFMKTLFGADTTNLFNLFSDS